MNDKKSLLSFCIAMSIFGTIGIFVSFLSFPSAVIALLRSVIGFCFLILYCLVRKQKINFSSLKKNALPLTLGGFMLGFNWILLFEAYRHTTVAVATLCYYTAPIFILILCRIFFSEVILPKKIVCIAFSLLGMVFVSGVLENGGFSFVGIALGVASAVLYGFIVTCNKFVSDVAPIDRTAFQFGISSITMLIYCIVTVPFSSIEFSLKNILLIFLIGIVHTGITYVLYFGSLPKLKGQSVAILSYIDPALAVILSALVLRQHLSLLGWVGAFLIIGASLVSEISIKKPSV